MRDRLKDNATQIVPCFLHFGRWDIDTVLITRRDLCLIIRTVRIFDLPESIPCRVSNRPNVLRDDRRRFGIKRLSFPRRLIGLFGFTLCLCRLSLFPLLAAFLQIAFKIKCHDDAPLVRSLIFVVAFFVVILKIIRKCSRYVTLCQ